MSCFHFDPLGIESIGFDPASPTLIDPEDLVGSTLGPEISL
jgi:hypothetical protein